MIRSTPPEGQDAPAYAGDNLYNLDGTDQSASALSIPGQAVTSHLNLQNDAPNAGTLRLKLPAAPPGWTAALFDALTGGNDITQAAQSATGWVTPSLAPGDARELLLRLSPSLSATADAAVLVRVENVNGSLADVVKAAVPLQSLVGLQWSLDAGGTWQAVPAGGVTVPQYTVLGLRGVRGSPLLPWPDEPFKPTWTRADDTFVGEEAWFSFMDATPVGSAGESINVECGNALSTTIRVSPDPDN